MLGNFVNRTTSFTASRYDGRLPEGGENGPLEAELVAETETRLRAYESAMEAIEFRRATAELRALWAAGNEYLHRAEPWAQIKTDPGRAATALRMALNLVRLQAIASTPFLPETSARILAALRLPAATTRGLARRCGRRARNPSPGPCHRAARTAIHQDHRR